MSPTLIRRLRELATAAEQKPPKAEGWNDLKSPRPNMVAREPAFS